MNGSKVYKEYSVTPNNNFIHLIDIISGGKSGANN